MLNEAVLNEELSNLSRYLARSRLSARDRCLLSEAKRRGSKSTLLDDETVLHRSIKAADSNIRLALRRVNLLERSFSLFVANKSAVHISRAFLSDPRTNDATAILWTRIKSIATQTRSLSLSLSFSLSLSLSLSLPRRFITLLLAEAIYSLRVTILAAS